MRTLHSGVIGTQAEVEAIVSPFKGMSAYSTDFEEGGSHNGTVWVWSAPYGSCYGNEIGYSDTDAAQNVWTDISDSDIVSGPLNDVTHDGSGQLTVTYKGHYAADIAGAFEADATNVHIQIAFSVNGSEAGPLNHFETFGTSKQDPLSLTTVLDLAAGDTVEVSMRTTDAGTPDLSCDHLMLRLIRIGGT